MCKPKVAAGGWLNELVCRYGSGWLLVVIVVRCDDLDEADLILEESMPADGILDEAFHLANTQGDFAKDGYCIIPNAVSKELCAFITHYARLKYQVSPNVYRNKDDSLANIHREYGDPLMETLLQRLHGPVEQITNMQLWPSLSFYYTYTHGNLLKNIRTETRRLLHVYVSVVMSSMQEQKYYYLPWFDQGDLPVCLHQGDIVLFKVSILIIGVSPIASGLSLLFLLLLSVMVNAYLKYDQRAIYKAS